MVTQFLPGESQGRRSLVGYSPWDRKESDTIERLTLNYLSLPICAGLVPELTMDMKIYRYSEHRVDPSYC